jgi:hypothetical protein
MAAPAPTSVVANTPTLSGSALTYTWSALNAGSYTVNLYQMTPSATNLVQTLTGTALTTNTYMATSGAAYMFTVVAYSGTGASGTPAQQVNSPSLLFALQSVGGPQGVQGNPGVQGLQGPQGPGGVQGPQGLQGVIAVNNYSAPNWLITSGPSPGSVNAQSGLTYGGTTGTFSIAGTVGTNSNTLTVGPGNGTGNAIYTAGTINAAGTNAHTFGPITLTNGAIAGATTVGAASINNGAATFTISNNSLGTNTNTLTVSVPTTTTCNAIYTAGTINAAGTNAHTFGPITLTNGAIAGATTVGAASINNGAATFTISNNGLAATTNTLTVSAPTTASCNAIYTTGNIGAPAINNAAGTFTVTGAATASNHTLTVGAPTTAACNAIYTAGTINAAGTNAHTLGVVTFTNGAIAGATTIGASGAITAGSTNAHTLGPITLTNGAIANATTISNSGLHTTGTLTSGGTITAPSINNAAGTFTVTGAAAVSNHTLTVGAPTTTTCNAIYTTGTINASGTNAHTLGVVTFTAGAIAGATTISNSGLHTTGTLTSGNITAPQVSASTGTFTIAANVSTSINTLTVAPPATPGNNAIYTTGTIAAGGFTGNVTGNCSGSSGSCTGNAAGLTGSPTIAVSGITCTTFSNSSSSSTFNGAFNGNLNGTASNANAVPYSGVSGITGSSTFAGTAANATTAATATTLASGNAFSTSGSYASSDGIGRFSFGGYSYTIINGPTGGAIAFQVGGNTKMTFTENRMNMGVGLECTYITAGGQVNSGGYCITGSKFQTASGGAVNGTTIYTAGINQAGAYFVVVLWNYAGAYQWYQGFLYANSGSTVQVYGISSVGTQPSLQFANNNSANVGFYVSSGVGSVYYSITVMCSTTA